MGRLSANVKLSPDEKSYIVENEPLADIHKSYEFRHYESFFT